MKKHVCIVCILVMAVALIGSPAQAKKAGEIEDDVYYDNKYDFSFEIPNGWSANVKNNKQVIRLTMDQKSPVPPQHFRGGLQDYMQIPTMVVIADTTSFTVGAFVDSLMSSSYETKQMDYFLKQLRIIYRPHEILKRTKITFDGETAILINARQAYETAVSIGRSDRAQVINDFKYGSIFFTVRDGKIFIIHMICEYETSATISKMFDLVINSLRFGPREAAEKESDETG